MTRRGLLMALAALPAIAAADAAAEVWEVLTGMVEALAEGNAAGFLGAFDPAIKGFEELRAAVTGLVEEAEVESSIDPRENAGDDRGRTLRVQWSLRLIARSDFQRLTDRQATVTIRMERQGRKWKVVQFEPASLFAPPSVRVDLAHQRGLRRTLLEREAEIGRVAGGDVLDMHGHRA
jgi:hypothetical protein